MIPASLARSLYLALLLACLSNPVPVLAEPEESVLQEAAPSQTPNSADETPDQAPSDTKPAADAVPISEPSKRDGDRGEKSDAAITEAPETPGTPRIDAGDQPTESMRETPSQGEQEARQSDKPEQPSAEAQSQPAPSDTPSSTSKQDLADRENAPLRIASWGGAYGRSQKLAYTDPFEAETGTKIELLNHGGRKEAIRKLGQPEAHRWDVVDLGSRMLTDACNAGHLEELDHAALLTAGDESAALEDFLPGALHKCGVASVAWSSVITYDKRLFRKRKPKTARDFFDVKRFPGKRGLRSQARFTLELALLADGVKPVDVYQTLATDAGADRAFSVLDKLKGNVVWWSRGSEPLALIRDQKVAMTTAFNGRIFNSVVAESMPVAILWDGQVYDTDNWAIPKGAARPDEARAFIAFALRPERMAAQVKWLPYGPMRKSALKKVAKHAEADVELSAFIPTMEKNLKTALKLDEAWWETQGSTLVKRFESWRMSNTAPATEPDGG